MPRRLELGGGRPLLMGILNASPDSFSDGRTESAAECVERGRALLAAGADIVDVGGESARGDRPAVGVEEEIARVVPVIEALAGAGALVSVDTYKAPVAEAAIAAGASIVNDVSGLRDVELASICARTGMACTSTRILSGMTSSQAGTWRSPASARATMNGVSSSDLGSTPTMSLSLTR